MDADSALNVHNLAFLEGLYEAFQHDPESIAPEWRPYLQGPKAARAVGSRGRMPDRGFLPPSSAPRVTNGVAHSAQSEQQFALQSRVNDLIESFRLHGHVSARIDPLSLRRGQAPELDPKHHGLSEAHLNQRFATQGVCAEQNATLREILAKLEQTYTSHVGVEYWHLSNYEEREWLREKMEACQNQELPDAATQEHILRTLARVEDVDQFLHNKFLGAKRFSSAGSDTAISFLDGVIEAAGAHDIGEVIIGMAHRGRLNVLMTILGKSPAEIFSEFSNNDPLSYLGSGDVKYHQGYYRDHVTRDGKEVYLALAFNPSHLEAITPVLMGRVRAKQDAYPHRGTDSSLAVTVHGDAAFSGQGVVMETLNMSDLDGYSCGGTIRLVINNQIGFTTDPVDSRSGQYCTDAAHILQVPVFHVNGDDPEAVTYAAKLAVEWRQRFGRDIIIDLVSYRKYGHNEGDDPSFTQPQLYDTIKKQPSVRSQYEGLLLSRGTVDQEKLSKIKSDFATEFNNALERAKSGPAKPAHSPMHGIWSHYQGGPEGAAQEADTRLSQEDLDFLKPRLFATPEGFNLHKKVARLLTESKKMLEGETPLNWATAELLAYGSLLTSGAPVRFTGQDACRGTFSHRHAVFTDTKTGERWCPLRNLREHQGSFEIHNSPLSEYSVLGFEFGYSLATPQGLVVWEAQFGDFANGAQVIIDQFLSSSEDKWNRISGMVLMLPHGYEGQGPEHSSARLERFLQLCAEDNMQVCNLSSPAQLFHAFRRQILRKWRKPLVIMTPKSLLRYRPSFSSLEDLTQSGFQRVIDDSVGTPQEVRRVILCSGKVYYDLLGAKQELPHPDRVALVRVEQLYPFPKAQIDAALARYPNASEWIWAQEEPKNMGAWTFIRNQFDAVDIDGKIRYVGRPESASPATGSPEAHKLETQTMLNAAFAGLSDDSPS